MQCYAQEQNRILILHNYISYEVKQTLPVNAIFLIDYNGKQDKTTLS